MADAWNQHRRRPSSLYLFNKPDESLRTGITVLAPAPQPAIENIVPKVEAAAPQRPDRNYLGLNIDVAEALLPTEFTFAELKGPSSSSTTATASGACARPQGIAPIWPAAKTVVLKASFNGQVEVLQSKVIDVANPIEIDMAADAVDR